MNVESKKIALYFGCADSGHYLFFADGSKWYAHKRDIQSFPWSDGLLDAGLLNNGKHQDVYDGSVFWTCGGNPLWLAFFWWDRSGDKRPNSNSGFYVQGFEVAERLAAFYYASSIFPQVVARQQHPLVLQP